LPQILAEIKLSGFQPSSAKFIRSGYLFSLDLLSLFGNGVRVAEEFNRLMGKKDVAVNIHHVGETKPKALPLADLYVFSSPGRMGRPRGCVRRFLKKVKLQAGTKYALLTTEGARDRIKRPATCRGKKR